MNATITVLALAILFQITTVIFAVRLMYVTKAKWVWGIISVAILLMVARRTLSAYHLLTEYAITTSDFSLELIELTISVFLCVGVYGLQMLFFRIKDTERKRERSESLLQSTMNTMPGALIIISEQGLIQSCNASCSRIFGYTQEEMIGRNIKMLMPEPLKSGYEQYLMNYLQGGEPKIIGMGRETLGQRNGGMIFPIRLSVSEMQMDGQRCYVGVILDLTVQKQIEDQLEDSHQQLSQVMGESAELMQLTEKLQEEIRGRIAVEEELQFQKTLLQYQSDATLEGILLVDPERKIISYNQRFIELWELSPGIMEAGNVDTVLQAILDKVADPSAVFKKVNDLYAHPEEVDHDELTLKDGRIIYRYTTAVKHADGKDYGRISYFRDVTAIKRLHLYEKLLPICAWCGSVRDDTGVAKGNGKWMPVEKYLTAQSGVKASHGICPTCKDKL